MKAINRWVHVLFLNVCMKRNLLISVSSDRFTDKVRWWRCCLQSGINKRLDHYRWKTTKSTVSKDVVNILRLPENLLDKESEGNILPSPAGVCLSWTSVQQWDIKEKSNWRQKRLNKDVILFSEWRQGQHTGIRSYHNPKKDIIHPQYHRNTGNSLIRDCSCRLTTRCREQQSRERISVPYLHV